MLHSLLKYIKTTYMLNPPHPRSDVYLLISPMRNEMNFVHEDVPPEDKFLFMGPFDADDGPFLLFNDTHTMAHIMHMAGCFKSVTQARKNGWDKPVPPGYQEIRFGKNRLMIYILNKLPEEENHDDGS